MEYPYGHDFFKIDHGESYFSFFDRMGVPHFNIAISDNKTVACGCGVIRFIPKGTKFKKVWYLCDLKVHPNTRGKGISKHLFKKNLLFNYLRCSRGYTISMNPLVGKNRVIEIIKRFPLVPFKFESSLYFFEISRDEAKSIEEDARKIIGKPIKFIHLGGIKDIVLKSTGKPMPLFHAQYGPMADPNAHRIAEEGRYMFCAAESSDLFKFLYRHFEVAASASILAHRMHGFNWDFILSSDV